MRKLLLVIAVVVGFVVPGMSWANPPLVPTGGGGYVNPATGTHYASAGSAGIVNTKTGAFMSSTGSGFVNSQTGAFVNAVPDATSSNPYAPGGIYADTTSGQPLFPVDGSTPYPLQPAGADYKPPVDKSKWGRRVRNNPRISKVIGADTNKVPEKPFKFPRGITFWRGKRIHAYCGGY